MDTTTTSLLNFKFTWIEDILGVVRNDYRAYIRILWISYNIYQAEFPRDGLLYGV